MSWFLVLAAGALEVVWASSLKIASTPLQWIGVIFLIGLSFFLLIQAYKTIPVAIAYAVFVGIGTIGTYVVGIYMGDPFSPTQAVALIGVLIGIIGVKVFSKGEETEAKGERA
jgi:paired small multidrug resistance pump